MRISKEIYETLKKVALGYIDYEIRESYLPASLVTPGENGEAVAGGGELENQKRKRGRPKKNSCFDKTYVVTSLDGILWDNGGGDKLICVKRDVVKRVHEPEVQALKMLIEIEKEMAQKESFDGFADDLLILSKKELIELRKDLLTRDLAKLL